MLCYASHNCGEESHARKLSTGGEFINAIWLLMEHTRKFDGLLNTSAVAEL
jgi:hypothetical protein